jgi:Flp pilus assembly protein TadG
MIRRIIRDEQGGAIIENTITMWVFLLLTMGITQAGLIMWSAVGIQHGVEMAARCASVSDAAIAAGLKPATTPTPCYDTNNLTGAANHVSKVQSYAASNSWGTGVPPSTFSVTAGTCASPLPSSLVSTPNPYQLSLINFLFSGAKISPRSCYPTNS